MILGNQFHLSQDKLCLDKVSKTITRLTLLKEVPKVVDNIEIYKLGVIKNIDIQEYELELLFTDSVLTICAAITFFLENNQTLLTLDTVYSRKKAASLINEQTKNVDVSIVIIEHSLDVYINHERISEKLIFKCFYKHSPTMVAELSGGNDLYSTIP